MIIVSMSCNNSESNKSVYHTQTSSINQTDEPNVYCINAQCNLMWFSCGEGLCDYYGFGVWWCTSIGSGYCNGSGDGICYHDCFRSNGCAAGLSCNCTVGLCNCKVNSNTNIPD